LTFEQTKQEQPMKRTLIGIVVASLATVGVAQAQMGTPNKTTPNPNPGTGSVTPQTNPKGTVAPSNTSAEEGAVKEKLRAAGLTGINSLKRNPDGTWEGRAMKNNAEVAVMIDTAGNIAFQ
jgi:hypothetical protein